MRDIAAQGTTVILVEQSVNLALTIAETAYFMEKGEIRFHGPTAELLERPDVLRSVFLEGAAHRDRRDPNRNGATSADMQPVELPAVARTPVEIPRVEATASLRNGDTTARRSDGPRPRRDPARAAGRLEALRRARRAHRT